MVELCRFRVPTYLFGRAMSVVFVSPLICFGLSYVVFVFWTRPKRKESVPKHLKIRSIDHASLLNPSLFTERAESDQTSENGLMGSFY